MGNHKDALGRPCSLDHLCRTEPEWAASRIRHLSTEVDDRSVAQRAHAAALQQKLDGCKVQVGLLVDHRNAMQADRDKWREVAMRLVMATALWHARCLGARLKAKCFHADLMAYRDDMTMLNDACRSRDAWAKRWKAAAKRLKSAFDSTHAQLVKANRLHWQRKRTLRAIHAALQGPQCATCVRVAEVLAEREPWTQTRI